jgi:hypothetical protein
MLRYWGGEVSMSSEGRGDISKSVFDFSLLQLGILQSCGSTFKFVLLKPDNYTIGVKSIHNSSQS